jgi:hypothetical protein
MWNGSNGRPVNRPSAPDSPDFLSEHELLAEFEPDTVRAILCDTDLSGFNGPCVERDRVNDLVALARGATG